MTTVAQEGRRFYLENLPFAAKDRAKSLGCKWDPQRRAWWTGKRDVAEQVAGAVNAAPPSSPGSSPSNDRPAESLSDDSMVAGRATYKGRGYILVWSGETRRGPAAKLAFSDGSKVFWAPLSEVQVTKRYQTREERGAYGRPTGRMEHMTFGRLQRLRERYARSEREHGGPCAECGAPAVTTAADSSGIVAPVCGRCAGMSHWERSFA